ncbi:hypothetical protein [Amylibacter sp. IMCC11727]|uniref:hypothetical protein n=1 Tax=Amylibacter sp. IMCC11727 TaxID=3039851 RepID=UPI00244E19DC|nr:hypothetical protein [Amylibacter sp. IMCC11727]WGI21295.1 hypothetical protein QBD29_14420 [Amylibacter sp. IMCC11727]
MADAAGDFVIGWVLLFLIGLLGVALILALVRWNPVLLWRIQPMWVWVSDVRAFGTDLRN